MVEYFHWATTQGREVDPRVLKYLDDSRIRYYGPAKRNMEKALGFRRNKRGNPGRAPLKRRAQAPKRRAGPWAQLQQAPATLNRKLTDDEFIEAGRMVLELISEDISEKDAIRNVAWLLGVRERTVREARSKVQAGDEQALPLTNVIEDWTSSPKIPE